MDARVASRMRRIAGELLLVLVVPAVLVAIHYLVPASVAERYVLYPDAYTPVTLFASAFLHLSRAHLVGNLLGYGMGAGYAYLLCLLLGERRWFWLSFTVLVFGLPVLVNRTSLVLLDAYFGGWSVPSRGFSGVAAGFGGFAFTALLVYVRRRSDRATARSVGLAIVLVLLWEVLVIHTGRVPRTETALVAAGVGLALSEIGWRWYRRGPPDARAGWLRVGRGALVVAWVLVVLSVLVVGLFPADVVVDGRFTNVFAHAVGLVYGAVVTGWGYRYWKRPR